MHVTPPHGTAATHGPPASFQFVLPAALQLAPTVAVYSAPSAFVSATVVQLVPRVYTLGSKQLELKLVLAPLVEYELGTVPMSWLVVSTMLLHAE